MTAKEAVDRWNKLVATQRRLEVKTLDLISHPDATDEQILDVCRRCGNTRRALAESRKLVVQWLYKKGHVLQANQLQGIR